MDVRRPVAPELPGRAQGRLDVDSTINRGTLFALREFAAMYLNVVYWKTGKVDQSMLQAIQTADAALVDSNPE